MVVFTNDKDNFKFGSIYEMSHTYTGLFVTDDRRAKCILQNVSVLCMYVCVYFSDSLERSRIFFTFLHSFSEALGFDSSDLSWLL